MGVRVEPEEMHSLELQKRTSDHRDPSRQGNRVEPPAVRRPRRPFAPFVLTFLITLVLWIVLSGKFDLFHLSLGVISCALVSYFSSDMLFPRSDISLGRLIVSWVRFIAYIPWLLYQIVLSNFHLLYLTFHPRMMDVIDPQIIRFKTRLRSDLSQLTFANSITLTPGTITIYVSSDGYFRVHAIDAKSAESLPGDMEERIAKAFGEN